jgi:predicted aconitase with swiveling domain
MPKGNRVGRILIGRPIVAGSAKGLALVSKEPLSFWGGLCPRTGEIIDRRHDRSGAVVTGRVMVFPWGRGSSTSSATLLESIKTRVAPTAIINLKVDPILALGSIVSDELYHQIIPIVVLSKEDFFGIKEDDHLTIEPDGKILVSSKPSAK